MAVCKDAVVAKVNASITTLENMTAKQKEQLPMLTFMEDYNKCRKLALEAEPKIVQCCPPEAALFTDSFGMKHMTIRYCEIEAYLRQLAGLIEAHSEEQSYVA